MAKNRKPGPGEERSGEKEVQTPTGPMIRRVQEKTGKDGIPETHVDYRPYKKKIISIPKK